MKRTWIFLSVIFFSIVAVADERSCYTVQLVSAPKGDKAIEKMARQIEDPSCQLMNIGNYSTIRCGCYDHYKKAKRAYLTLKNRFKHATIAKSYAYRFKSAAALKKEKSNSNHVISPRNNDGSETSRSCYTVQLWSVPVSAEKTIRKDPNFKLFGCREMRIGRQLTARCGCFDRYKKAKQWKKAIEKHYPHAFVTKTYAYRFENPIKSLKSRESHEPESSRTPTLPTQVLDEPLQYSEIDYDEAFAHASEGRVMNNSVLSEHPKDEDEAKLPYKLIKKSKIAIHYAYERYLRPFRGRLDESGWDFRYRFGARISYDVGYVDEAEYQSFKYGFRRVRVYHRGSFFDQKLFYKTAFSFTGNNHVKDLYLGWRQRFKRSGFGFRLKGGNLKIPQSIEGYTSSKYLTFMERSLGDAYAENRRLGLEARLNQRFDRNFFTLFADYYNSSIDEKLDGDDKNHPTWSTRGIYTYRWSRRHLLTIGATMASQDHDGDSLRLKEGAESVLDPHKYVHVRIRDVDTLDKYHFDALYLQGPFSMQGGYTALDVDSLKGIYRFAGYYLQAGYFIRGEGKRFDPINGIFKRIRPVYGGDIEAALRFSYIDLNDKDEHGGSQSDYTMALNWYLNPNTRLMFNYILAFPDDTDLYDGMYQIIQSRILFSF